MKRAIGFAILVGLGSFLLGSGAVLAERMHAPKGIWKGMATNLSDVQGIASAVSVLDMKRASEIAEQLTKRQHFLAGWEKIPEKWRKSYAELAEVTDGLLAAAKAGDEQETSLRLGKVLAACSTCHYDLRDAKRREKMKE